MRRAVKKIWLSLSVGRKLSIFACVVLLVVALSTGFSISVLRYSLDGFGEILNDNLICQDFQQAMEEETRAFERYVHERSEENREQFEAACARTESCVDALPFSYNKIGEERYARTWNIKNGYEGYSAGRDALLLQKQNAGAFIDALYRIYAQQEYLLSYARRLIQETVAGGNANYASRVPVFNRMFLLVLFCALVLTGIVWGMTRLIGRTMLRPILHLAEETRKITKNDFDNEILSIENRDEIGELVSSFNVMKQATRGYIRTLKENQEMAERLHQEELERIETEKQLDAARLEFLKSQINPHFLFNTLNMIAGMAELEEADTTEKMIHSMSSLFRYNLSTSDQVVPLRQELRVVQDYMYLQQMRFGSRIQYICEAAAGVEQLLVPAFTLQPLVENAIIHGLSKKEQGGQVTLKIWQAETLLHISVADTGIGMSAARLQELTAALKTRSTARVGIGLGNIYKRIHGLYAHGDLTVVSEEGRGTEILMTIPQEENNVSNIDC